MVQVAILALKSPIGSSKESFWLLCEGTIVTRHLAKMAYKSTILAFTVHFCSHRGAVLTLFYVPK